MPVYTPPGRRDFIDAREHGALGDGATDNTAAVSDNPLQDGVVDGPGTLYFPAGNYRFATAAHAVLLYYSDTTWKGDGIGRTRLYADVSMSALIQAYVDPGQSLSNITFEDMDLDANNLATNIVSLYGAATRNVTFRRCRFLGIASRGVTANGVQGLAFEDCVFERLDGTPTGTAIYLSEGCRDVAVRRSRFEWVRDGLIVDTGASASDTESATTIRFEDNYLDGWWWLLAREYVPVGTVTYTATTVTDTGASFPAISAFARTVRAMPQIDAGTAETITDSEFTDTAANFVSAGARKGQIITVGGTKWTVVDEVQSATTLRIEGWRSLAFGQWSTKVAPPADGSTYIHFNVLIGAVQSSTSTTLTVDRWHDLDGATATPVNGTRYELMVARPNYPVHCEQGTHNSRFNHNTFRRGWSDQLSVWGHNCQLIGNIIEDGEDMGITHHGHNSVVSHNWVRHQGAGGIYLQTSESTISDNVIQDTVWVNSANTDYLGDIISSGDNNTFSGNSCKATRAMSRYGIVLSGAGGGNLVDRSNKMTGHATGGVRLASGLTGTGNRIDHSGTISTHASAAAQLNVNWLEIVIGARAGTLVAETAGTTKTLRLYNRSAFTWTVAALYASVDTAPTGSAATITVWKNGSGTGAQTVSISAAASTGSTTGLSISLAPGDYLQAWSTAVGSTIAGTDLTVVAVGTYV